MLLRATPDQLCWRSLVPGASGDHRNSSGPPTHLLLIGLQVVDETSACVIGHRKVPLSTSHASMNRFGRPGDRDFQLIASNVLDLAGRAPEVLHTRFDSVFKPRNWKVNATANG